MGYSFRILNLHQLGKLFEVKSSYLANSFVSLSHGLVMSSFLVNASSFVSLANYRG